MKIEKADLGKEAWNAFVRRHYPPIGAFMQAWEWGEFQKALGRKVHRCMISDAVRPRALFSLIEHSLPLNFAYGYAPRGPVFESTATAEDILEMLSLMRAWAEENHPEYAFLRLEPPLEKLPQKLGERGLKIPSYYVQPRFNHAIRLQGSEEAIQAQFHPSTRANIRKAERRGVSIALKRQMTEEDYGRFFQMTADTIRRNSGKNAYPGESYFRALLDTLPSVGDSRSADDLSRGIFFGYQDGKPVAIHIVLFFAGTATYLYGASFSDYLRSKVATALHWKGAHEAKRRGMAYYDLGGVDERRWPTLTNFKRQFRGRDFAYAGNVDIPIRPMIHRAYDFLRRIKKPL